MSRSCVKTVCDHLFQQALSTIAYLGIIIIISIGFVDVSFSKDGFKGQLVGQLVDKETGESLIGAAVMLENTKYGVASDLNGAFSIKNVPPGTYTVIIHLIGYAKTRIESVEIGNNNASRLEIALQPECIKTQDVIVEARAVRNTESSLLKQRQKSNSVSDAISAEAISRYGSSNAADAIKQITGASVVSGKYVFIRGLGDRYSLTQLNGVELPSADPNKKTFQMDMLPSNLLDNIVIKKSFTPDQPGSFTGGIIDIGTKTYPESFTMQFSSSSSYTVGATGNNNFLTYKGGSNDWLGMDDGTRDLPDELEDNSLDVPDIGRAYTQSEQAYKLDGLSKSFNDVMAPTTKTGPLNKSYSFSIGNQVNLFGRPLGFLGSVNYRRSYSFYENGTLSRWRLTGNVSEVDVLSKDLEFKDSEGKDEVLWGGMALFSYKFHPKHEVAANFLYTQSGESSARYLYGKFYDGNLPEEAIYETRTLKYTQRNLQSIQTRGNHHLHFLSNLNLDWMVSYIKNEQDEPDTRYFSNDYIVTSDSISVDTTYSISPSHYRTPQRNFRYLDEDNLESALNLEFSFKQWSGLHSKLKAGGSYSTKGRTSRERKFQYWNGDFNSYDGDPEEYFADQNVGIIDSSYGFYVFGNYIKDYSNDRPANYDGDQTIAAAYSMVDLAIVNSLRFIGGIRFEKTRLTINLDGSNNGLNNNDLLPSLSFVYQLEENMNLRTSYGRTLARPTFRELAPFPTYDIANGFFFNGNPDLKRTLIDNYDLRWEWFVRPGEIYSAGFFYKSFTNPIERAIKNENGEIQYQNVDRARIYGFELEIRKKLDQVHTALTNFQIGGNLTLADSRVEIPSRELSVIRAYDENAKDYRPLWGHSDYIINLDLGYHSINLGTGANLNFNVFGERLSEVSDKGTPNIFESPRASLNFNFSQRIFTKLSLKFSAKNLLVASIKKVHHYKGNDFVYQEHSRKQSFSLGVSYNIN